MTRQKKEMKLIIDKVTFTLPIDKSYRLKLLKHIRESETTGKYKVNVLPETKDGRYKNNYLFCIDSEKTVLVSAYPINTNHNFLWVEYSPNNFGHMGSIELRNIMLYLLGRERVMDIYFRAKVNRLDLAIDLKSFPSDLFPHKSKAQISAIFRSDETGKIESHVIGSEKSDIRITIYDKDAQQGLESDGFRQRFEINLRNLNCSLANLDPSLVNEFREINFFDAEFLQDSRFSYQFQGDTYYMGLNSALAEIEDYNIRKRYLRYLEDYRAYPLNFDNLNFHRAHYDAFRYWLHPDFQDKDLVRQSKSLLLGAVMPARFAV